MTRKILLTVKEIVPIAIMIGLIPLIVDDYILSAVYLVIIIGLLFIKKYPNDVLFLVFGFIIMTISEFVFISVGVETFNRVTFLNTMPLWLPFLWACSFMVMKRVIKILES
jgi:hypothetical protein